MLEKLIDEAKQRILPALLDDPRVDNAQASEIAGLSGETLIGTLMSQLQGGDQSGIMEMLSGKETTADSPVVNQLQPNLIENLVSRLGLSPDLAQHIAGKIVPLVMNMLNGQVRDAQDKGMDIGGMLSGMLSGKGGGSLLGGLAGGMMGKLGGLFGKR